MKNLKRKKGLGEFFAVPKNIAGYIPVDAAYDDGIMKCGEYYTASFGISDINYISAGEEEKERIFLSYCSLINSFDPDAVTKITVNRRKVNQNHFEKKILFPLKDDTLDCYRREFNDILRKKSEGNAGIREEKYITVSAVRKDIGEARIYFNRVRGILASRLKDLGSEVRMLDASERLRILHDFYRSGEERSFSYDASFMRKKGHDFREYIAPDSIETGDDYMMLGEKYARVLFLKEYASYIKDSMIGELTGTDFSMMLSVDIIPIPTEEAVKEIENRLLGVETNIANWQRRQNRNNNYSAAVPYDMELQRKESREFLDDLTTRDQKMMCASLTIVHLADTKEELDAQSEEIKSCAARHMCQIGTLRYRQPEGLSCALPIGAKKTDILRTLTTESLAVLIPFKAEEICHEDGIYYGQNAESGSLIIADRKRLLNGNSFILGVSGSGKSFAGKCEITSLALRGDSDIIIIDPEREYSPLTKALKGTVIDISAVSRNHINAMDMSKGYGDGDDPLILKSEFILSLCEQLIGKRELGAKEKSIIDRCTKNVYSSYIRRGYTGYVPTLRDFRSELLMQEESEASEIALALELFTDGSLNTFSKETNVDTDASLICYDILDLGKQLMPIGMLIVLDSILNRISENRKKGRSTFIFIDEIYLLFLHEYSANFLFTLWKRVRKYGAFCTGITQNVDDLLESHTARTMLANSEFVMMLNQAATDRIKLAEVLGISESQMQYITNVEAGRGLLKTGSDMIPFINAFPKGSLYKLMTTDPKDNTVKENRE